MYKSRVHNLCFDNCHSHVATALNLMKYDNRENWNMLKLTLFMLLFGKYLGFTSILKTNLPFIIFITLIFILFIQNIF